jgi:gamma-glutamylcyclotransferase (GGCT)/AIG2-like uncharacterized protein YtfP
MKRLQLLFSYGTLRQEEVQKSIFGRTLPGQPDTIIGYRLAELRIDDPGVIAASGSDLHTIMIETGDPMDRIPGTVFEVSEDDLAAADAYETSDYRRIELPLLSGGRAWAYVR